MRKRRNKKLFLPLVITVIIIGIVLLVILNIPSGPEKVVRDFYTYEAEGSFDQSWTLFHPDMKIRFPKATYIQTRSHVFMQHMNVETFSFEIGKGKKKKGWRMNKDGEVFAEAYEVPVDVTFHSQFGIFTMQQNCYVVKEKGEWLILWDYRF
ncbi:hypothetical protein [Peribacillus huizhouensis]|uniref:Uncharacterized protein n=1 Tax=Peribacillus huizhouensis TaxID=1501239 RepID=A0ABR6CKG4_9BACI|nr:hypothetical protein [Peribacillus huizhouensis]MBA9025552.1 hypothetical protein [Peribacillus huizhouensis]